jgi:hypothetical protein
MAQVDGWVDGWINSEMDGWMNEWMGGWMDIFMELEFGSTDWKDQAWMPRSPAETLADFPLFQEQIGFSLPIAKFP